MTTNTRSHVIDDGKTRIVAVLEGGRSAVIHATKYGERETTLVSASMSQTDAAKLGFWLIENCKL